jgi:HD-like signal output (HDOD) protein
MSQSLRAAAGSPSASPQALELEQQIRADIAAGKIKLPVLPAVATEVLSSSLDDSSDAARLAELIQQDQSLASHVLRVVNSPAFRGTTEIVALQQAIARLGMVRIREIALTASLKNAMTSKGSFQELMDEAWRQGLAAGLWSKEVARATRRNVEQAYLCGLLHNIGQSFVAVDLGKREPALALSDAAYLMQALGREAGIALVTEWQLPPMVSTCITFLGHFAAADADADDVAVVEAGCTIARAGLNDALDAQVVLQELAVQHLNLYPDDVETLLGFAENIRSALEGMVL